MVIEEVIVRFAVHGIGLGYIIGLIDAWNEKVLVGLITLYFAVTLVLSTMTSTTEAANAIAPSGMAVVAQFVGALIGIHAGKVSYQSAFE